MLLTSLSGSLEARLVRDDGHDACVANDRVTLFSKLQLEREISVKIIEHCQLLT